MASRLRERLEAAIARERDPTEQLLLRAERIGLLAREGLLDEARRALAPLHAKHAAQPEAAGAAALALAEALLAYYSDLNAQARAKLQQARALAASAQRRPLQALCAAWLAHLDYVSNELAGMCRHAALAFALSESDHHAARSRAGLVVAMSYHHAGRPELAQRWYELARRHAQAEGDSATISALLHNMAALRVYLARQSAVTGEPLNGEALTALAAAESSRHFDAHLGASALPLLEPILRAQALAVLGRWAEALALYEEHLPDAIGPGGLARMECSLRADMAFGRLQLEQPDQARAQAELAAAAAQRPGCDVDDLAFSHARLAKVYAGLGQAMAARRHAELAQGCWRRHAEEQLRIVTLMDAAMANVVVDGLLS